MFDDQKVGDHTPRGYRRGLRLDLARRHLDEKETALGERLDTLSRFRREMNDKILSVDNLVIKQFLTNCSALDS